jgi:hypothetical protein
MKSLKVAITLLSMATLLFACPFSVSCPADQAEIHKIGDDYSGLVHLAIYEHAGERCGTPNGRRKAHSAQVPASWLPE